MYGLPSNQLSFDKKQEKREDPFGAQEILQALQETLSS
jgi:hypothetical protein